jgi:pheromone shutdown protein TraB
MEEAVQCGAAQVILGDRPAFVTQRRLAQGLWDALSPRVLLGFLAFNAAIFAGAFKVIDDTLAYQAMGASLLGTALGLLPVALPFWELYRFSEMSAEEIEACVEVPEPVESNLDVPLKLYGEDALLDWPGASESIIAERDRYMAKSLAAAATGAHQYDAHLYFQIAIGVIS